MSDSELLKILREEFNEKLDSIIDCVDSEDERDCYELTKKGKDKSKDTT